MYAWEILIYMFICVFFLPQNCIERMLNLTDHLRRLRVDRYEYVAMKVIVLLSSGLYFNETNFAEYLFDEFLFRYFRFEGV